MDELLNPVACSIDRSILAVPKPGMVMQRSDGSIEACNAEAEAILGWTLEQMQGWSSIDFSTQSIHADGSPFPGETHPAMETLRTGLPCQDVLLGLYRPDGSLVWLLIDSQPLFRGSTARTRPDGVVVTFADVTVQVQVNQAQANQAQANAVPLVTMQGNQPMLESLRQNQQFTDHLINTMPGVLHLFDVIAGRTLYVSEQATSLLGYLPAQVIEPDFLAQVMHPDDRVQLSEHFARLQTATDEALLSIEYRMRHVNGEWRWFVSQDRVFARTVDGRVQQVLGIAQDISDRKQAEFDLRRSEITAQQQLAELEFIYATAPIGLCFLDRNLRFVRINDHLAEINGVPAAEHIGRTVREIIPEMADQLEPLYRQVLETGEPILNLEVSGTNRAQPGVLRDWLVSYYPVQQGDRAIGINIMVQEITDRKRAEVALQETEARLRVSQLAAKTGTWDWNIATGEIYWSEAFYALYGLEPTVTPSYATWLDRLVEADREAADRAIQTTIAQQQTELSFEYRVMHPTKGVRWFAKRGELRYDAQGQPLGATGISIDIHDRKQNEIALHRSNAILNTISESTTTLIYVKDCDGRMLLANSAVIAAIGQPEANIIGRTTLEFCQPREAAEQIMANDRLVLESGETIQFEEILEMCDRRTVYLSTKSPYRDDQGNVIGLIGVSIDITRRKQAEADLLNSEARYRMLAEAIPQFVFVTTPEGENEYVNQQFCRYTGLTETQLLGSGWLAIVHPDDLEIAHRRWLTAVQTGDFYEVEYRFRRADGYYRWFLGQGIPLKDEQGRALKWFGTCTDIHEQKQIAAERSRLLVQEQAAREQAEAANRIKDEFLAVLSHELRTPLNPILGWAKLLQTRSFSPEKLQTALATIERNAQLQVQLIDDLLDVSRIIRGKLLLDLNSVSFTEVVHSALETVRLAAEAKSIAIDMDLDPQPITVLGDAGRLQQIVWNLVSNAIKFTPAGGRVQVKLEARESVAAALCDQGLGVREGSEPNLPLTPNPSIARLTISDTGRGIASNFLPYIFEAFRQQDGSTTRSYGGLGLGLAIVRQLVELHGGTIRAESAGEGQGAIFTVELPLMSIAEPTAPLLEAGIADLQEIRVLVVDDEADSLEILTVLLEQEGAIVTAVDSAAQAIAALQFDRFDLLISDIGMPEADGYVLIGQVRRLQPEVAKIPAIALTAYASEGDRDQVITAGYQQHLAKPIEPDLLVRAIAQLVQ